MNAFHGHCRQCAPPKYEYEEGYGHRAKRIGNSYYQYDLNGNIVAERNGPFPAQEPGEKPVIHDMGDDVYYVEEGWGLRESEAEEEEEYSSQYRWDERNRMVQSGNTRNNVAYEYGEDGERTGKFSSTIGGQQGETLYFNRLWNWRYDGSFTDHNGRESKHIFLGESRIVTKVQGADGVFVEYNERTQQYYYHGDHLGSAQVITNYQGVEYERLEYTPYGELWVDESKEASDLKIPYRFTGKERDEETGLYYYGARYLDPRTSRWISTDPAMGEYIPGAGKGADGLPGLGGIYNTINMHTYHYAGNNPINLIDPNGRGNEDEEDMVKYMRIRKMEERGAHQLDDAARRRAGDWGIYAIKGGEVVQVDEIENDTDVGYGNSIVIRDSNGEFARYAHLESTNVGVGDLVFEGQTIGVMGETGAGTTHLHVSVYPEGTRRYSSRNSTTDPEDYIREGTYPTNTLISLGGRFGSTVPPYNPAHEGLDFSGNSANLRFDWRGRRRMNGADGLERSRGR